MIFNASENMLGIGVPALRIISLSFLPAALGILFSTLFQAVGHGVSSLIVSVLGQLVVLLPAAFFYCPRSVCHPSGMLFRLQKSPLCWPVSSCLQECIGKQLKIYNELNRKGRNPDSIPNRVRDFGATVFSKGGVVRTKYFYLLNLELKENTSLWKIGLHRLVFLCRDDRSKEKGLVSTTRFTVATITTASGFAHLWREEFVRRKFNAAGTYRTDYHWL